MSDNISISDLMDLAELKAECPEEYEKTLKGIKDVTRDIFKMGMDIAKEMADE